MAALPNFKLNPTYASVKAQSSLALFATRAILRRLLLWFHHNDVSISQDSPGEDIKRFFSKACFEYFFVDITKNVIACRLAANRPNATTHKSPLGHDHIYETFMRVDQMTGPDDVCIYDNVPFEVSESELVSTLSSAYPMARVVVVPLEQFKADHPDYLQLI